MQKYNLKRQTINQRCFFLVYIIAQVRSGIRYLLYGYV